jgi:hypothetical protein
MKVLLMIIAVLALSCAALATPISIVYGVYEWVGNDLEFKHALWEGVKMWLTMLIGGLVVGLPCYVASDFR